MRRNRWFRLLSECLAALGLVLLLTCWHFHIWSFKDYRTYKELRRYPIGEDLWYGRIEAGEDVTTFAALHPPQKTRQLGRFTVLDYYSHGLPEVPGIPTEGVEVIAKDGRLVFAGGAGYTWQRLLFDMSQEDKAELQEEMGRFVAKGRKE
jgi:hypothetical protein